MGDGAYTNTKYLIQSLDNVLSVESHGEKNEKPDKIECSIYIYNVAGTLSVTS